MTPQSSTPNLDPGRHSDSNQDHTAPLPLLTEKEAARYLGTSPQYLVKWRFQGKPIAPFVRIGRMIRYRWSDIEATIANRVVSIAQSESTFSMSADGDTNER